MTISAPVTVIFTAAATDGDMRAAESALHASGFTSIRREVHPVPAGVNIPLAPPTVEVTTTREVISVHLSELGQALSAIRRELPELGLMLRIEEGGGKAFYTWQRSSSADDVAAGVIGLDRAPNAPGAYGWDTALREWTRV